MTGKHPVSGGATGGSGGGPRKESSLELAKLMDSSVRVKVLGGREFVGILRGYDDLVNLVLEQGVEYVRGTSENCLVFLYGMYRGRGSHVCSLSVSHRSGDTDGY
jgi:small nuclear ribonucleoprotein (snRNP)-like protein